MEKANTISVLLLVMVISVLGNGVDRKIETGETLSEIDKKLKLLNKPAVKSIKSEDGDIIDCVDIYKQPALDHPALRNHKIQLKPSVDLLTEKLDRRKDSSGFITMQTWQKSGSCPKGTVPIRRVRRQDLMRADSLDQFGRKAPEIPYAADKTSIKENQFASFNASKPIGFPSVVNRSAALLLTAGYNYIGAQGDINVWNPNVDLPDDYTTAQIWLKNALGDNFESIEGGWTVYPKLYGDKLTRLFVYWTRDGYKSTGCFNTICSGFVQTGQMAPGAAISPISSSGGPQYFVKVGIFLDSGSGNWWLKVNGNIDIGYWPGSLFKYLSQSAILVQWGGQVYSPNVKKTPHTKTAMGSGGFSHYLLGSACSIQHVRIIDYSGKLKYPQRVGYWADEYYCYDSYNFDEGYPHEPMFFFGGPGQNPNCK